MTRAIINATLIDTAFPRIMDDGFVVIDDEGNIHATGAPEDMGDAVEMADEVVDAGGLCLGPGLVDVRVKTGEPGEEHRETIASAAQAAVAGGVTRMVLMPDTQPVIDDVALIEFLTRPDPDRLPVHVHAAGALTVGLEGEAMAEIGLMKAAGAVYFTNGDLPVRDAGVMKRAMAYAASHGAAVASRPDEVTLSRAGVMQAGAYAAQLGLAGIPAEAEWIGAARDLMLAEATGCELILDQVSTARTLELVEAARARGVKVRVIVGAHHLFFNLLDVGDYLTYCKVRPPFRSEADRSALVEALSMGQIDAVVSGHDPQPPETKRLPFAEAAFGAAGLETTLAVMLGLAEAGHISLLDACNLVSCGPARLAGLRGGALKIGDPADFVLFDPRRPWKCAREALRSRSVNSPFDGRLMTGQVMQTWIGGQCVFDRKAEAGNV